MPLEIAIKSSQAGSASSLVAENEYRKFDEQLDKIKKGQWLSYEKGYVMAHASSMVLPGVGGISRTVDKGSSSSKQMK